MNENVARPSGQGFLVVQVATASNAIPLRGANVRITDSANGSSEVLFDLVTGADGRTDRIPLPAPRRSTSLTPSDTKPYAAYGIEVSLPGYESVIYSTVPIFDGITAIQQANLIPLPEAGYTDDFTLNAPHLFDAEIDFGL